MHKDKLKIKKSLTSKVFNTRNFFAALAVLLVVFVTTSLLVRIGADADSRSLYLYHSDSTITANFAKDLFAGDALGWDMSTQIFIFPEIPLVLIPYLASSIFNNPFLTQAINSFTTVGLFVTLMYFFAKQVLRDRFKAYVFMLASLGLFALMAISENFLSSVASLSQVFLVNTYYYGAVLTSILGLLLILILFQKTDKLQSPKELTKNKRLAVYVTLLIIFFGLSLASNGLYIAYFFGPAAVLLFLLFVLNSINGLQLALSYAIMTASFVLSKILIIISGFLGITQKNEGGFSRYIDLSRIPESVKALRLFIEANHLEIEIGIIFALIALSLAFTLLYLYRLTRNGFSGTNALIEQRNLLGVNLFIVITSASVICLFFLAGQIYILRYLTVLVFVPMLALLSILKLINKRPLLIGLGGVIVASTVLLCSAALAFNLTKAKSLTSFDANDQIACVVDYLDTVESNSTLYAASDAFDAKTIDYFLINGNVKVLDNGFAKSVFDYHWLTNAAMFGEKNKSANKLNYVILTGESSPIDHQDYANVGSIDRLIPVQPDEIKICGETPGVQSTMLVYYYKTGSEGWKYLNGINRATPL